MLRKEVYTIIDSERDYQDNQPKHSIEQDKNHSVGDWLWFIQKYVNYASDEVNNLDTDASLEGVRKIAALCVACMEYNETKLRK